MNLFRSKGGSNLLRRVARRFRRGGRPDVLVEHGTELVEGDGAIVVDVGHVEHPGQRFFRRGLIIARQQVEPVHDGREPVWSRRRVDGVEGDATTQHERAVNSDFHTDENSSRSMLPLPSASKMSNARRSAAVEDV